MWVRAGYPCPPILFPRSPFRVKGGTGSGRPFWALGSPGWTSQLQGWRLHPNTPNLSSGECKKRGSIGCLPLESPVQGDGGHVEGFGKVQHLSIDVLEIRASIQTRPTLGAPVSSAGFTKNGGPLAACPWSTPSKGGGGVWKGGSQPPPPPGSFQFSSSPGKNGTLMSGYRPGALLLHPTPSVSLQRPCCCCCYSMAGAGERKPVEMAVSNSSSQADTWVGPSTEGGHHRLPIVVSVRPCRLCPARLQGNAP